jgi:hypothetical protein
MSNCCRSTIIDLDGHDAPCSGGFVLGACQLTVFASGFEK